MISSTNLRQKQQQYTALLYGTINQTHTHTHVDTYAHVTRAAVQPKPRTIDHYRRRYVKTIMQSETIKCGRMIQQSTCLLAMTSQRLDKKLHSDLNKHEHKVKQNDIKNATLSAEYLIIMRQPCNASQGKVNGTNRIPVRT